MHLNQQQFLGSLCNNPNFGFYNDYVSGCGDFTNSYGTWLINGVALVQGQFVGNGYFYTQPVTIVSGYASGFKSSNPLDFYGNGLPYVTYSGDGTISGSDIVSWFPVPGNFLGRNSFYVFDDVTVISGMTVLNNVTGNGNAWISGLFYVNGNILAMTGCAIGTGYLQGSGVVVHIGGPHQSPICSGWFQRFLASGDFAATGVCSGYGFYSTHASDPYEFGGAFPEQIGLFPTFVWGSGDYFTVDGNNFSGFCSGPFWGSGTVRGPHIFYPDGLSPFFNQQFWGSGAFTGIFGWLRGTSGWYHSDGNAKGVGNFSFIGVGSGLLHDTVLISGSGVVGGAGTIFLIDPSGVITGVNCIPPTDPTLPNSTLCGNFPPFMNNCTQIGNLPIDFTYGGNCVVEGQVF